ncbi:hypothetical protein KKC13_10290 [bacterium]|nr:hypothetical protein [bacterium]MBU1957405.1 hypothetical protein [bacterium]
MIKQTIKLYTLSLALLLANGLWTSDPINKTEEIKKRPVDEGQELKPKADKIKGITFNNDEQSSDTTILSLADEDKVITIHFTETSRVPLTCNVIRQEKEPKNPKVSRAVKFQINKSKLQIDDKIVIINRRNVKIRKI